MSLEDNKEIARRFLQAWTAGGQGIVDELASPDLVVEYSSWLEPVHGPQDFKALLTQTFSFFPDMRATAHEVLAEGDRVVVRWSYEGTHENGELFGHQARGRRVQVSGITIYRIAGVKVVEERGVVDSYSLMLQVGGDQAAA